MPEEKPESDERRLTSQSSPAPLPGEEAVEPRASQTFPNQKETKSQLSLLAQAAPPPEDAGLDDIRSTMKAELEQAEGAHRKRERPHKPDSEPAAPKPTETRHKPPRLLLPHHHKDKELEAPVRIEPTHAAEGEIRGSRLSALTREPEHLHVDTGADLSALRASALEDYEEGTPVEAPSPTPSINLREILVNVTRPRSRFRNAYFFSRDPHPVKSITTAPSPSIPDEDIPGLLPHAPSTPSLDMTDLRQKDLLEHDVVKVPRAGLPGRVDRFKESYSGIDPAEKKVYKTLGIVLVAIVGLILLGVLINTGYNTYAQINAVPTPTYPYPVAVSMPGEIYYNLHIGAIGDGYWFPTGAEWLLGTEVCRWVALPWNRQNETAVQALQLDDPIMLTMSNRDLLEFHVESVEQIETSLHPVTDLNDQRPCLYLFLVKKDSEDRWLVTAVP